MTATLLVVHAFGASCMTGIGWFVQSVHYPLFGYADPERWGEFHAEHSRRTARVVCVPWAAQGFTALALILEPGDVNEVLIGLAVVLAGISVVATVGFALPAHRALAIRYSPQVERHLVRTSWIRTVAWTAGAVVAGAMLLQVLAVI